MSIIFRKSPTSPNLANGSLVFEVTSNNFNEPQFQYVADVKINSDLVQRIKQQPNPSNRGVFDVSQIITNNFAPIDQVWKINEATENLSSAEQYEILFGEEFGTSTTSSVTLFNGVSQTAGDPEAKADDYYFILNGTINALDTVNFNWPSSSKYNVENPEADEEFVHQNGLTNWDEHTILENNYHTISFLVGNLEGDVLSNSAQDVYAVTIEQNDDEGNVLATDTIFNLTLRNNEFEVWSDVFGNQTFQTKLVHFPAGPQNFKDAGITFFPETTFYNLTFNSQLTNTEINPAGIWGVYRFDMQECSGFESQRFAWKNEFGVFDYYNFTKAENVRTSIDRKKYKQTYVDFSAGPFVVEDNKQRRGKVNYLNKIETTHTVNSDWLTQDKADKLRELFYSTDVFLQQEDGEFLPIVITTTSITEKTNPLSQKVFQYQVEYKYAIQNRTRL